MKLGLTLTLIIVALALIWLAIEGWTRELGI
jgi:hypothetical protein